MRMFYSGKGKNREKFEGIHRTGVKKRRRKDTIVFEYMDVL